MGNHYGLIQGHLDFNLSEEGRKQAVQVTGEIRKLIGGNRPLIFSSDLSRAWETATIIAEELGLNLPIPDRRLRERNMGILQDKHWTTVDWTQINGPEPKISNLETRKEFLGRIEDFLSFVSANKPAIGKTVIAVTHGGTLTFIYYLLLGIDLDKVPHIGNAVTHVFNLTEEKGKIRGVLERN